MDFASVMKTQILRSKQTCNIDGQGSKYIKRSELEAEREARYREEQEKIEQARLLKAERKRLQDEEDSLRASRIVEKKRRLAEEGRRRREIQATQEEADRRKRLGLPQLTESKTMDTGAANTAAGLKESTTLSSENLTEDELIRRFRALNEPICLFGETFRQKLRRYRHVTAKAETAAASNTGLVNAPIRTKLPAVNEADMKIDGRVPTCKEERYQLFCKLASFFNMVLREWDIALSERDESVKVSFQGKAATNAMVSARDNLRPLFKKMERDELDKALLEPIIEIVTEAQARKYVNANDAYLRLSIGKAAWPIGVTMVGIHERSAREKLHQSDKGTAHIMSDETTRKLLQGIKRCLTFAQTRWPPDDQMQLMG